MKRERKKKTNRKDSCARSEKRVHGRGVIFYRKKDRWNATGKRASECTFIIPGPFSRSYEICLFPTTSCESIHVAWRMLTMRWIIRCLTTLASQSIRVVLQATKTIFCGGPRRRAIVTSHCLRTVRVLLRNLAAVALIRADSRTSCPSIVFLSCRDESITLGNEESSRARFAINVLERSFSAVPYTRFRRFFLYSVSVSRFLVVHGLSVSSGLHIAVSSPRG